ncbi:cadherin-18 isoform X1 [Cyclopterus lumpus]|uniref:cadherin-18 isoform X1 n=1 Tax=Cyclopterus lumpus TaxID=8103 RepID=UPI001486F716|nr:cadherin-18 isoform X1 [Cyclopterus lumpus]
MRIPTTSCLCPFLVCLCFIQRCCGASHHVLAQVPSKNQTKLANGGPEVHHRPKRGWIWNQFFVLEEHLGPEAQYVGKLHSNSDKGDGSVRYILSGDGAGTIFIIDEVTGDIHAAKSLDRERKTHYVLHAQALDRNTEEALEPKSEFIIKVQDINDNAPKFPDGPFVATVPEMSELGTSVLQITASDADDPTYGNSARIVYSILQGQPYFSVDPKTGIIRTALSDMDREAREHYTVIIQAKDMAGQVGGLSGSTTINITLTDVNDNPPMFPQKNYQLYVPESAQVGKAVGKIKANDEDLGINADIKYSIINSEGANMFSISTERDTREGIISLKKPLNYERKKTYTLHIEGTNTHVDPRFSYLGSFKDTATLKITVGDVDEAPVFSIDHYIMDVYENSPSGTEVGAVTARDPDSRNSPVRYFLDSKEEGVRLFRIDESSGLIRTTQPLDREDVSWHNITVMASEVDSPSLLSHVHVTVQVLDVNDNPPEIATDGEVIVCESSRPGQLIQTVTAVDKDDFANGQRFSFALPSLLPVNPNFTLKDNEDSTASIIARRRRFNHLTQDLYELPIVVWDGGEPSLSGTSTLTLRVCPCQSHGRIRMCQGEAFLSSAGLSTGALIAILLCIVILLAIVVLFVTLRRSKKEPLIISEEDIRENVVTYDDEGGGEEDTEAFDIIALRNPAAAEELKFRRDVRPEGRKHCARSRGRRSASAEPDEPDVHEFIRQRLAEADMDTGGPPYDSLQTYAYEGQGSPTGSVSPLDTPAAQSEQDYNFLDDWGPEFQKLAELYAEADSDATT